MEYLNRPAGLCFNKICSLHGNQRFTVAGLILLLALGLWLMLRPVAEIEYASLLDGQQLSAPQMARMVAAFQKHGLQDLQLGTHEILIPRHQKEAYLVALDREQAWPADLDASVDQALTNTHLLMPWQQSRENLRRGEKQMLSRVVQEMNGIASAVVQYDEVPQPGFPPRSEVRAMVAVRAVGQRHLDEEEIEAIRDTVVAFKGGLERRDVTITDLNACRAYPGTSAPASYTAGRSRAAIRRAVEEEFRTRIEQRLAMYPGILVTVNARFSEPEVVAEQATDSWAADALRPDLLSVAIDVPRSYFRKVWRQRYGGGLNSSPPHHELEQIEQEVTATIERAVTALLPPLPPERSVASQVTVTTHEPVGMPRADLALPPEGFGGLAWMPWLPLLGFAAAALGLSVLLYQRLRAVSPGPANEPSAKDDATETAALNGLHEQLAHVVKRDPAAAADVLKQWLKRAA